MANEEPEGTQQPAWEGGDSRSLVVATTNHQIHEMAGMVTPGDSLGSLDNIALGLPGQIEGMPTAPSDRGDEVQDRFRYQWAVGAHLLTLAITGKTPCVALWCEHHDDFLIEEPSGTFVAVQVKSDSRENAKWRVTDSAFLNSIKRFCELEEKYGSQISQYEFCSNSGPYIPGENTESDKTKASSPMGLREACVEALGKDTIKAPYAGAFQAMCGSTGCNPSTLFIVLRKLKFRNGPPLRGYLDTLIAKSVPAMPNCSTLPVPRLQVVRDELMRLVESACGIPSGGVDGVLAYIASNGRPEVSIRGKCILVSAAKACVEQASQSTFRYVRCGESMSLGHMRGQKSVLQAKLNNAYIHQYFEPLWKRALAAEERLMAMALAEPETTEELLNQLESTVLVECQDAEALARREVDERKRGALIYSTVLENLIAIAKNEPSRVHNESKDTLMGMAGLLSGSCKFAWGVPLEGEKDGV
ncbi:dsDNA nuclease domain-containing protein [Herbaspirillum rubrisubalbicans]|nr:dsDNA nuclease domain-containing protein [Herbaspirillum rubrisubalbicans]